MSDEAKQYPFRSTGIAGDARADGGGSLLATLVDNAPDAIARLGRDGRIRYANGRLGAYFHRAPGDLAGSTLGWLGLPRDLVVRYRRAARHVYRDAQERGFDFEAPVDGTSRSFAVRMVPERDDHGRVASVLAITSDVTARVELERQRDAMGVRERAARADAENATRARDQFLAIISHELRSPLNGIQSWSHVLENQLDGPERPNPVAMRALEGIRAGIDQQVRLIEHLLDATVSMTGTMQLARQPLGLREPIEAALAEVRAAALAKDLALYVEMQLTDDRIDGDPHRLRQIFGHLLSNALKFTPQGGSVWVSARRHGTGAVVVVRDSGRGLPPGSEQWLFEPFSHADSSNTRRSGGIGLGLALARRLVDLHGGRIEAESGGPHLGSTFTVRLPLEERRAVPREAVPVGTTPGALLALAGMNVLVVDDQLEAREALSVLLTQFGVAVDVAASSRAGLETIEVRGTPPDIVICDIAMPEEDGYGFVRRLRAWEARHADRLVADAGGAVAPTPVVALSAFATADSGDATGPTFDTFLAKPVDPPELLATLSRLVLATRRRGAAPAS